MLWSIATSEMWSVFYLVIFLTLCYCCPSIPISAHESSLHKTFIVTIHIIIKHIQICFQQVGTLEAMVLQRKDLPAYCLQNRKDRDQQFARMRTALASQLGCKNLRLIVHAKEGSKGLMIKREEMTDNTELVQRN